jgi:protease I
MYFGSTYFAGKRVAFLVSSTGVSEVELIEPRDALRNVGAETVILALEAGNVATSHDDIPGVVLEADADVSDAHIEDFDGLIVPGGSHNCAAVAASPSATEFVDQFVASGKPVAGICHAAWVFVAAGIVPGRQLTSWPGIGDDVLHAGGRWVDRRVVVDGNLVTSRMPEDIPALLTQFAALLDR